MSSHAKGHAFHKNGLVFPDDITACVLQGTIDFHDVVAVDGHPFHAVAGSPFRKFRAAVLFLHWGAQGVAVVLDEEDDRQIPYGGEIKRFMKLSFAGPSFA